ncbi:hypothetical protein MMC20_000260 [Loxospora ochrophaea]|nr:hypothetical protein [Loxospora ochrophaea]
MPLYQIEHIIPLTPEQQDALASALTTLHTRKFTTPSLFVNVQFRDVREQVCYVAGKRQSTNRILANVRSGASRTSEMFNELCGEIVHAWDEVVNGGEKGTGEKQLWAAFVLTSLAAGMEAGFVVPKAGEDVMWLKKNRGEFEKLARGGDGHFGDLGRELEEREDLRSAVA